MSGRYHLSDVRTLVILFLLVGLVPVIEQRRALAGTPNPQLDALLPTALSRVYQQLALNPPDYPIYTNSQGAWVTAGAWYWSSGFWPGQLWLARDLSGSSSWTAKAQTWTGGVQSQQYDTTTHDVGFKIFPPFMNGYRLTGDASYCSTIRTAAGSMATRYNPIVGCIKSDEPDSLHLGQFPVATDDVPTLEILLWAARNGGQAAWRDMAISHALRTRDEFIRPDAGTYHVVWFHPSTGEVLQRGTMQGYSDESTWTRGQAWAIHGFVMCYHETGDRRFLATARTLADYYLSRLPADHVPPWDFDAGQPAPKDTSAAAIVAAALLDLSRFTADQRYWDAACNMLISLCSPAYLSSGTNSQGILLHGTYNKVTNTGVDASCIWGDYFFLQAIQRYRYLSSPTAGSYTSPASWQNRPMPVQRGTFGLEYDATPSAGSIDGVMGLSADAGTAYANCAVLVRFNPSGYIDVRNGSAYQADVSLRYTAGTSYHFRLEVDVPNRTYSVHVTPSGGSEVQLAGNYAFRAEQTGATYLDNWAIVCQPGSFQVSDFQLQRRVHNLTRDTWHVTVQEAIDAAEEGNEIVLEPGTYTGYGNRDIDFDGKAITVRSTNPYNSATVAATVIDCQGTEDTPHRGFILRSGEGRNTVLDGLTIIGGYAPTETINGLPASAGGAIGCFGASPTIRGCEIHGHAAQGQDDQDAYGGAVFSDGGSPFLQDCLLSQNRATGLVESWPYQGQVGAAIGGAICCLGGTPVIQHCRIEDNDVVGGNSTWYTQDGSGGGVYCDGTTLIQECIISGNLATGDTLRYVYHGRGRGGGICCSGQTTILNCRIDGNQALNNWSNSGSAGGGICCSGTTLVRGCDITDNESDWGDSWGNDSYEGGGGIYCQGAVTVDGCLIAGNRTHELGGGIHAAQASLTATNCRILGNHADAYETGAPSGGGILCGDAVIRNCLIADNYGLRGGGLALPDDSLASATIINCTVAGNSAFGGGGLFVWSGSVNCSNSILWGNAADRGNQIALGEHGSGDLAISWSNVQDGQAGVYLPDDSNGTLTWADSNLDNDPRFVDANGSDDSPATWADNNYHLAFGSPCIDAGDPAYTPASGETDIDGQSRVMGSRVDIGADEAGFLRVPLDYPTIQAAVDAAEDGCEVIVAPGVYEENVVVSEPDPEFPRKLTLRSADPDDPAIVDATIIKGSEDGPVVTMLGDQWWPGNVLSGFTITHGPGLAGVGVDVVGGRPVSILNCVITDNPDGGISQGYDYSAWGWPMIVDNCIITGNHGTGIACGRDADATITNCLIAGNAGTGIVFWIALDVLVSDCVIVGNQDHGIYRKDSYLTVRNCTIAGNQGVGIYGFSVSYVDFIEAYRTIIWGNAAEGGSQIVLDGYPGAEREELVVLHSNIQGGHVDVSEGNWTVIWDDSNLDADPLFADPDGLDNDPATWADNDYHLTLGSPCRNAGGFGYVPPSDETDIDGQPRLLYGRVDIGADEYLLTGDITADGYVNVGDLQALVAAWGSQAGPPPSINWNAAADINDDGYVNVGDLQILVANWGTSL